MPPACSKEFVPGSCHIRPFSVDVFKRMIIKWARVQAMSYKAETVRLRQYVVKLEEQGRLLAKEAMHWRTKWTQSNYQNMQMYSELSASSRVIPDPSSNHGLLLLSDSNGPGHVMHACDAYYVFSRCRPPICTTLSSLASAPTFNHLEHNSIWCGCDFQQVPPKIFKVAPSHTSFGRVQPELSLGKAVVKQACGSKSVSWLHAKAVLYSRKLVFEHQPMESGGMLFPPCCTLLHIAHILKGLHGKSCNCQPVESQYLTSDCWIINVPSAGKLLPYQDVLHFLASFSELICTFNAPPWTVGALGT